MISVMKKRPLGQLLHAEFSLHVNTLSVQIIQNVRHYHMYNILNMYFCNVCAVYQNEFATLTWIDLKVTQSQTRCECIYHISILSLSLKMKHVTCHRTYFSVRLFEKEFNHIRLLNVVKIFIVFFSKRSSIIYGSIKECQRNHTQFDTC